MAVLVQLNRIADGRVRVRGSTSWSNMWCLIYQEAERRHLPLDSVSPFRLSPHPRAPHFPPPRGGPARTGEGARRPIQAPPPPLPRVSGAPPTSPQQSLQPPTVSPTTPSAGGPNWEDRPTTKTLSTGTQPTGPPIIRGPLRARCSRRSSCRRCVRVRPRRGPPPRLAGACVLSRQVGGCDARRRGSLPPVPTGPCPAPTNHTPPAKHKETILGAGVCAGVTR